MNILIACEFSGIVRNAFAAKGHFVLSCDLRETELPGNHYCGSVYDVINEGWDMMIAHPPCTYLSYCGARWFKNNPEREKKRRDALDFFEEMINAPIPIICVENTRGWARWVAEPTQKIQPYQFGYPISKEIWLWLKNLNKLQPTKTISRYQKNWMKYGSKGDTRARERTIPNIAQAMADQWL